MNFSYLSNGFLYELKIQSDKLLVADKVFQKRYIEGYAKIPASELNLDFIDCIMTDFIDSCIINSNKARKSSLAKRIDEICNRCFYTIHKCSEFVKS